MDVGFCRQEVIENDDKEPWFTCKIINGKCVPTDRNTIKSHSKPAVILWQTFFSAGSQLNDIQQHNAKFLPEGSEMRWVDDAGMASMVRSISRELAASGN